MAKTEKRRVQSVIGWREWVSLPALAIPRIKAKIDTGARSSALHACAVRTFERGGKDYVRFKVHPMQRSTKAPIVAEAEILEYRRVRSSSGHQTNRPVIRTEVEILGELVPIDLTLTNRDEMGFRLLLGREAIRGRWFVDAGRSFYAGRPLRRTKKKGMKKKPTTLEVQSGTSTKKRKKRETR